jgi:hypothetical protein
VLPRRFLDWLQPADPQSEGSFSRTRRDTVYFVNERGVAFGLVAAAVGAAVAIPLAVSSNHHTATIALAAVGSAIAGFLAAVVLAFVCRWPRVPFVQRDEARRASAASRRADEDSPTITAELIGGHFNHYYVDDAECWGKYFMIEVEVPHPTRGVRGHVRSIATWDGERYVEQELRAPIPLCWARGHGALAIYMHPLLKHQMTFVLNQQDRPQVLFSTDTYEPTGVPYGLGVGRHQVEVLIQADQEGVEPATLILVVEAPARWDHLNVGVQGHPMPENDEFRNPRPYAPSPAAPRPPYAGGTVEYPPAEVWER